MTNIEKGIKKEEREAEKVARELIHDMLSEQIEKEEKEAEPIRVRNVVHLNNILKNELIAEFIDQLQLVIGSLYSLGVSSPSIEQLIEEIKQEIEDWEGKKK